MKTQFIKRTLSALSAAALFAGGLTALPANAASAQSAHIMGDLDGDTHITITDAKQTLDVYVASLAQLSDNDVTTQTNPADIDMNGYIEMADAIAILRYFCQSLAGDIPLWSDIRKLSYHDGTEYNPYFISEDVASDYEAMPFEKRGMYLEIGCAEGKPGETVSVPVYIAGIADFYGFQYFQNTPEGLTLTDIRSDLGIRVNGITHGDPTDYSVGVGNLENGAFVWADANAVNLDVKQGMVIAEYEYQIPEDAQAGDTFVISANNAQTMFVTCDDDSPYGTLSYQYTLLDGVVAVK